jgi:hypothetical protein
MGFNVQPRGQLSTDGLRETGDTVVPGRFVLSRGFEENRRPDHNPHVNHFHHVNGNTVYLAALQAL